MYETALTQRRYRQLQRRGGVAVEDLVPRQDSPSSFSRPQNVQLHLHFERVPAAADVAEALLLVDRATRRVVTAIERGVDPVTVRGAALGPRTRGFQMQRADPGSLDVVLQASEAIYIAITSQPLSFALNLASLTQLGHMVRNAAWKNDRDEDAITLDVPTRQIESRDPEQPLEGIDDHRMVLALPGREPASIPLPGDATRMRLITEYADGSAETITYERRPPTP